MRCWETSPISSAFLALIQYTPHARDDEILKIGIEQDRVILTADKELFKRIVKVGVRGVLVSGGASELEDLIHILTKNGITSVGY